MAAGPWARDTIAAVSTAPGRGAIAVVRLSGADVERICHRVVAPRAGWPLRPREATRCVVHAPDDPATPIDDALITLFPAPHSYTGETVVELGTHGGAYVPQAACAALVEAGAREARPGEFTERAVWNGKLDLLRAEAIADLIDARSRASHRAALGAAREELAAFREAWTTGALPAPVIATHVRAAGDALGELIGTVDVDEVFARVFATFCVEK